MEELKLNIIVIDDNIKETDPLMQQLRLSFKEADIILKDNAKDALDFILNNLNNKMIVLLDYDMGKGEPNGTEIFLKIREKTSLLNVIIITDHMIDIIPNKELVEYVNKNALAVIDKTISLEEKIKIVNDAIHSLDVKLDSILEQWIFSHSEEKQNELYLSTTSGQTYTLKDILTEIRNQTDFGRRMERNILMLAIDLLTRGKKQINDLVLNP